MIKQQQVGGIRAAAAAAAAGNDRLLMIALATAVAVVLYVHTAGTDSSTRLVTFHQWTGAHVYFRVKTCSLVV